jgi:hypothetical protein
MHISFIRESRTEVQVSISRLIWGDISKMTIREIMVPAAEWINLAQDKNYLAALSAQQFRDITLHISTLSSSKISCTQQLWTFHLGNTRSHAYGCIVLQGRWVIEANLSDYKQARELQSRAGIFMNAVAQLSEALCHGFLNKIIGFLIYLIILTTL